MRQRKKLVHTPKEYWKKAIGFDIDNEFRIYRYLCGKIRWAGEVKKIDEEKRFTEYKSWRKYVEGNLTKCDPERLAEFYHFLKLNEMECDIGVGMDISLLGPFMVAYISGTLAQCVFAMVGEYIPIDFASIKGQMSEEVLYFIIVCIGIVFIVLFALLMIMVLVAVLLLPLRAVIKSYIKGKYKISFLKDYLEITEALMPEKKEEKLENVQIEG